MIVLKAAQEKLLGALQAVMLRLNPSSNAAALRGTALKGMRGHNALAAISRTLLKVHSSN